MSGERLSGVGAVVTGASRGIGRAIAIAFGAEGASVLCVARSRDGLEETCREVKDVGGQAFACAVDLTVEDDVLRLPEEAQRTIGPVDVLVNNAGKYAPGRFLDQSLGQWREVFDLNVFSVVAVTQAFLPGMLGQQRGKIINIASTAGKYGSLYQSPYNASKHAVVGLTRCLALETAKSGVRVNAICPGFVDTEFVADALPVFADIFGTSEEEVEANLRSRVPIGRFVRPDEVAALALYLACGESDAMTGQSLTISGGLILV